MNIDLEHLKIIVGKRKLALALGGMYFVTVQARDLAEALLVGFITGLGLTYFFLLDKKGDPSPEPPQA